MSIVVTGGNGFLGTNLVHALLRREAEFRCVRRARSNVLELRRLRAPMVVADLDDAESLERAFTGSRVVIHAAAHYPRLSLAKDSSIALGLRQTQNVLDAAARAKVSRLIFVSSTATVAGAPGEMGTERHRQQGPPGFGTYHDLKWHMEALVDAETRFETIVACPGACLGPFDWRVGTQALLVALARGIDPPHPDGVINTVDVRDVADALVTMALERSAMPQRLLLVAENHRLHPLLVELARRYGCRSIAPPLSADAARSLADSEEARAEAEGGRPAIAREIVDLIVHSHPIDATLSRQALGLTYRSLPQSLGAFDAWARRMGIISPSQPKENAHDAS